MSSYCNDLHFCAKAIFSNNYKICSFSNKTNNFLEPMVSNERSNSLIGTQADCGMTVPVASSINIALHPPQKSSTQRALGNRGQLVTSQGRAKQGFGFVPSGHTENNFYLQLLRKQSLQKSENLSTFSKTKRLKHYFFYFQNKVV